MKGVLGGSVCLTFIACSSGAESTGESRQAITSASPDGADPAVVALLYPDGSVGCTGTLIAKRTVLTAAHCVEHLPNEICFGAVVKDATCLGVRRAEAHPAYSFEPWVNDIALVHLTADAPVAPVPFPRKKLDDTALGAASLRIVGYGTTKPTDDAARERRSGMTQVSSVLELDFSTAPSPSLTCSGDSGGPAFMRVDGSEVVVGVTRSGDDACAAFSRFTRVDPYGDAFIAPRLDDGPVADEGGCGAVPVGAKRPPFGVSFLAVAVLALVRFGRRLRAPRRGFTSANSGYLGRTANAAISPSERSRA